MEILDNGYERRNIGNYESFKKNYYQYRVDEILGDIETNNAEYIGFNEESERLYKELQEMLGENGKKTLVEYADTELDKKGCELYALAKQIYIDLKDDKER